MLGLATGLIGRGHRVDLVLFRRRIHYTEEVPDAARLFVLPCNWPDGHAEGRAADMLGRLDPVSAASKPFDWVRAARAVGYDPLCLPGRPLVREAAAIAAYMAGEKPDCVLPSLPRPKIATLLACCFLNAPPPVVPTVRNVIRYSRRQMRQARHLFPNATHFVGVSRGVSESVATAIGLPSSRITTIYNPVVTRRLLAKMEESPNHPWLQDGGVPVILAAGRLDAQKDYPTLLKAFAHLARERNCRLIILGEGERRKELEGLVDSIQLTERVSMPGWVENPFAFMSRASLFVLSSRQEGLPGVLIQALACGCPCVSTDCPAGPAEILQNGQFGPLVPVGNHVALAAAMAQVLDKPPDPSTLKQRGACFSEETAVVAYERLISSVVQPRHDADIHGSEAPGAPHLENGRGNF